MQRIAGQTCDPDRMSTPELRVHAAGNAVLTCAMLNCEHCQYVRCYKMYIKLMGSLLVAYKVEISSLSCQWQLHCDYDWYYMGVPQIVRWFFASLCLTIVLPASCIWLSALL